MKNRIVKEAGKGGAQAINLNDGLELCLRTTDCANRPEGKVLEQRPAYEEYRNAYHESDRDDRYQIGGANHDERITKRGTQCCKHKWPPLHSLAREGPRTGGQVRAPLNGRN